VALGLVTALLVVSYIAQTTRDRAVRNTASVPVVVATKDIAQGALIGADTVGVKLVTPDVAAKGAFPQTQNVVGQRARYAITTGAQLIPGMIVQPADSDALSFVVPPGKRAVAVATSDVIGGGNHIRPGDFVDVMAQLPASKVIGGVPNSGDTQGVFTILQNIEVLAVSNSTEKLNGSGPQKGTDTAKGSDQGNSSLTLAVDPSQSQLLFLAESEGKIRLTLRPFGDDSQQQITPLTEPLAGGVLGSRPAGQ
jgi:pilus assembly protein CpaB